MLAFSGSRLQSRPVLWTRHDQAWDSQTCQSVPVWSPWGLGASPQGLSLCQPTQLALL